MKTLIATAMLLTIFSSSVLGTDRAARVPVIVELFTSEGCSSCPGADEELEKLVKSQPIAGANVIGLAFHVDYWNKLGWPDRFSAREFTQRQYEYAKALPTGGRAYTPQMIVDGTSEFVGSDSVKAVAGIKDAASKPKSAVDIVVTSIEPSQIKLRLSVPDSAQPTKDQTADALVALTEDDLTSDVNRGENAGRKLHHAAVVRQLKVAASATGPTKFTKDIEITISLDKSWEPRNLKAVAFVQDRGSRQILAAGAVSAQASR